MPAPYPQEFREDVVRVARNREPGQKLSVIAKDLGISESCLTNWMRQADAEDGARPGKTREESSELCDARKRIRLPEQENEVLRRAAAYLSQANLPGKGRFYASVSSHPSPKFSEQRPADVSLEAPSNLALGEPFGTPALNVFAGDGVVAHPRADDDIDGTVELPVARAGESVATGVARGGRQRSYTAESGWAGATDLQRFATISSANIEVFYIWFESSTGEISEWGVRVPADLGDEFPERDELWRGEAENGDTSIHGATLGALLDLFAAPGVQDALVATYERRQGPRRRDWHNPYLGALLGASGAPVGDDPEPTTDEDVEFERRYIERVTKHRLHQAPLREAALQKYGEQCMYCGLDVPQILEAAHVIPDSKGGAASTDNIRILCANHHAAFDADLIVLEGDLLVPAPGARDVPPGRPIALAMPEPKYSDAGHSSDVDELEDDERYQWVVTAPEELTPNRLGDTFLYDRADDSDLYVEGTLHGIHVVIKDPSHPGDITYQLDIRPTDQDEIVTVTLNSEGYVSRYVDTEDPEAW